jgi:hypothetical protein
MKKLGKFIFWMAGFLYTMKCFKRVRNGKRLATIKREAYDALSDIGLSDAWFKNIWGFILVASFLLAWPLWLIQVILDLTLNED